MVIYFILFYLENPQLRTFYSTVRSLAEVTMITTVRHQDNALADTSKANSTVLSVTDSFQYK